MHPLYGVYHWLPTFFTRTSVRFTNSIVSSLVTGQTINKWRYIFLQVTIPSISCRAEVPYDKYLHIYLVYRLFWSFILCAALLSCAHITSKKYWWRHGLIQNVRIYNLVCSISLWSYIYHTKIAFRMDRSFLRNQVLVPKIHSNCFNLNSLTSFESYHF